MAYSLLEVLIGMSIFVMVAGGLISMTFQVRATAEENVYQNTALALGQAYLEQIRSIDFTRLSDVALGTSGSNTLALIDTSGAAITDEGGGSLTNGEWARETIMLDETQTGVPRQPMLFRFRPLLTDLASNTSGAASGVEITVFFETTYNYGVTRTYRSSLRTVRSNVPTY
jgi:type II secretory pathway pseudopilin PulG